MYVRLFGTLRYVRRVWFRVTLATAHSAPNSETFYFKYLLSISIHKLAEKLIHSTYVNYVLVRQIIAISVNHWRVVVELDLGRRAVLVCQNTSAGKLGSGSPSLDNTRSPGDNSVVVVSYTDA